MATFTQEEIEFLKQNGNDNCSRTWLGLWDPKRAIKQEHRDFMIDKYERKRYYLEPASPLKSLPTNASSSLTSLSGGSNNKNANESLVPLKTPTLTPPATLRLNRTNSGSCNGLNNVNASSSSLPGAVGVGAQFQQQFTPDDSGFFSSDPPKILPPTPQKNHMLQRKNGIKLKQQPSSGLPASYGRNQKNGLLNNSNAIGLSGSSGDINANKFTPDADFVADFGSAAIVNNVSNGGSHYGSANSLKNSNSISDNGTGMFAQYNGNNGEASTREMENFADFDHNPIFNSAGLPMMHGSNNGDSKLSIGKTSNSSIHATPSVDRYAALKDLDEQFREIKLEQQAEANNNTITPNGTAASISDSITPTSSVNPFKTANPFQPQQQQQTHAQQQQQQTMAWPISGAVNGTTPDAKLPSSASVMVTNGTGFYATSPYQGGFVHGASSQLYNGNVANGNTMGAAMGYLPTPAYHPNGNGYSGATGMNGVMMGAQFNATANGGASMLGNVAAVGNPVHHFANFGNPFMAAGTTAGNSNNPFL
uniref:Arf-GAP domain-containing protein n=1 Tax=Anopheles christyi TaxID=43041 RepID=A0A182KAG9_9DIPT